MRRLLPICLLSLSAAALFPVVPASSDNGASTPSITRVTPMRISVGNLLTVRGRNFKPRRNANTIIFRAPNGRSAFAKPRSASRTKLVLVVPAGAAHLLATDESGQKPTRLKLRVLAGRFSSFTSPRLSPVVTAAGAGDGTPPPGG